MGKDLVAEEVSKGGMGGGLVVSSIAHYAVSHYSPDLLKEVVATNLGEGQGLSEFDLDRVRVPAGAGLSWQIPTLDGMEEARTIEGVIVAFKDARAFWRESFDQTGGGRPPDCASDDCITGIGDPGGACIRCPMAVFGSAEKDGKRGRGQACKQMRLVFVLRKDNLLPMVLVAPPSSLRAIRQYFLRLASQGRPYFSVVTRFELEQDKSKDGIKFSRITPKVAGALADGDVAMMRAYSQTIAPAVSRVTITVEDATESD